MAVKNRLKIVRQKPGENATGLLTAPSGIIICGAVAVEDKLSLDTPYKVTSPDGLAAFGLSAAYDTANQCLVYYHLKEFFRMAQPGTALYFMCVGFDVTPVLALEDEDSLYAKKLLQFAEGSIRQLGIAYNPDLAGDAPAETLTDGFSTNIRTAIPAALVLRAWAEERIMDLCVILEGRKYGDNLGAALDLRAIAPVDDVVSYEGVGIVIGQDYAFADDLWASGKYHAALGTALGTLAGVLMEQDMGEVETLNVTDVVKGVFTKAGLSSHKTLLESDAQLDDLDDRGYVFLIKYAEVSGFRWNGDHVCAPVIIDDEGVMNEWKMSYTRTVNEAKRKLYAKLIGKVRTTHQVDATTGKLPLAKIKNFEALGDDALGKLSGLSGYKTIVDPNSDLITPPQRLTVGFKIVPFGTVGEIAGTIVLKSSL